MVRRAVPRGGTERMDLDRRLKPGVTIEQAASELSGLIHGSKTTSPRRAARSVSGHSIVRRGVVGNARPTLTALFAAVALVLLIASANAADLPDARRSEKARIRRAPGARRRPHWHRRAVIAEIMLLAIAAGAVGLFLTWGLLRRSYRHSLWRPRVESIRVDAAVVLYPIAIALTTAAVTGIAPVLSLGADVLRT